MSSETKARRCAIWFAISELRSQGYLIDRCCGRDRTFDLIAWNREHVLSLIIRTARTPDIRTCHTEVTKTSSLVLDRMVPGIPELWLYHPAGKSRYSILPGGAIAIREAQV
ncbi:MAG TPA: hypothetical protein PK024_13230 [Methanospirillum sp.]|uniref:hypothetical protein n=1 Tax=Methanospirillum sp. TaxID=45200 RepID=UPI002CFD8629|nr:hypothetical protein [Methanospirillum sp.]HOJ97788.1 hypothetical protein [Methanospirillum sp.]HOL41067.1 hypothetical protein [Methanospirillum sp.]HPP78149.1 hypothetical protein [Methanospirillum sp.]